MTYIALRTETGHFYEELGRFLITKKELLLKGIINVYWEGKSIILGYRKVRIAAKISAAILAIATKRHRRFLINFNKLTSKKAAIQS